MSRFHEPKSPLVTIALICLIASISLAGSKVLINEDGVTLADGRKVFPIAFTMPPPPDGKTPTGKDALAELRDAGASFLRTGPMAQPWNDQIIQREQQYLDAAAKHGLYCLIGLRELSAIDDKNPNREAALRSLVTRFKDHPGLGMWKGSDEPEWGKVPVEACLRARQIIREIDDHPIWIVQAPRGTVESLIAYDPAYDVTGMDIYPVGYPPGAHSLGANKEISMVGDYTKMMMKVANGKKPVWMTLQIAWSGVIKPGKTLRFPTFPQQRFMTYQAVINGARGLVYFGGHIPSAMTPDDAKLGWNWTFWTRVLRPVIEEIGAHSPLHPALVAPASQLPIQIQGADDIEFTVRETPTDIFILACKREGQTVNVRFTGLPPTITDGEVLFESPRRIQPKSGSFTDWFAPFDVHVYRFPRRQEPP